MIGTLKRLAVLALATASLGGLAHATRAEAATVRSGAQWSQMDVLLDGNETAGVTRGFVSGAKVCWGVGLGAAALGARFGGPYAAIAAVIVGGGYCVAAVMTCAAQAYYAGRWAGMTFSPAWYGIRYWCWKY